MKLPNQTNEKEGDNKRSENDGEIDNKDKERTEKENGAVEKSDSKLKEAAGTSKDNKMEKNQANSKERDDSLKQPTTDEISNKLSDDLQSKETEKKLDCEKEKDSDKESNSLSETSDKQSLQDHLDELCLKKVTLEMPVPEKPHNNEDFESSGIEKVDSRLVFGVVPSNLETIVEGEVLSLAGDGASYITPTDLPSGKPRFYFEDGMVSRYFTFL